jgi:dTDP-3-amino-2,3,6-trideoxy-4-keto-D-glucose/dTDP-3-amino-3,4,6-trideoxy-alpha-D-glucose/dTDP-2,6-dideoxy-D-kanosamine transaminase
MSQNQTSVSSPYRSGLICDWVIVAVRYSYLAQQFGDCPELWAKLQEFVATGDFTLGKPLAEFEDTFAHLIGSRFAIGVNSGTDAIKLSLRALGIKPGDEVITAANTFVATVGAIAEIGAIPVFVDCNENFCMDVSLIESAITVKTRAIVPVHFTGYMTQMDKIVELADKHNLIVVEDACQSILASYKGRNAGTWGQSGAFSLHPLKNINVWSDGGVIVTDDEKLYEHLRLLRNHGLSDRDHVDLLGYNSRLDTFQAVVGNWLLPQAREISNKRISNAKYLDSKLNEIQEITIPNRPEDMRVVYHLYSIFAESRDELLDYCLSRGIEAKVHYPIPIYKQKALKEFSGGLTFPIADELAAKSISFPCDQHLSLAQLDEIAMTVSNFYENRL